MGRRGQLTIVGGLACAVAAIVALVIVLGGGSAEGVRVATKQTTTVVATASDLASPRLEEAPTTSTTSLAILLPVSTTRPTSPPASRLPAVSTTTVPATSALIPVESPLDVEFVSDKVGWVAGYDGQGQQAIVARTVDGGRSWQWSCLNGLRAHVWFIDAIHGWATTLASDTTIWQSADGGASWTETSRIGPSKGGLRFVDAAHGVLDGNPTVEGHDAQPIRLTNDGGRTWTPIAIEGVTVASVWFTDAAHGVALGTRRAVAGEPPDDTSVAFTTDDGGQHWTAARIDKPVAHVGPIGGSGSELWAIGEAAIHSNDRGATWERVDGIPQIGAPSVAVSSRGVFLAGQLTGGKDAGSEAVAGSTDGGATWFTAVPPNRRGGAYLSLTAAPSGIWAAGFQSGVAHTTDLTTLEYVANNRTGSICSK